MATNIEIARLSIVYVVIPFKNDKELNFLDLTHASGTKISCRKKIDGYKLKVYANGKQLTETYKWINNCFGNKSFYAPVYFIPQYISLEAPQYSSKTLIGNTTVAYPIEGLDGLKFQDFDWWIEEPNKSRKYFPDEVSIMNYLASSHISLSSIL